jgi:hypothetical protein
MMIALSRKEINRLDISRIKREVSGKRSTGSIRKKTGKKEAMQNIPIIMLL